MIASPPSLACHAPQLFERMRTAIGGSAWARYAEVVGTGRATASGLDGTASVATDVRRGLYATRFRLRIIGNYGSGFDGRSVWSQDISGGVHALDAPFSQRRAVTDAYLARMGYFEPGSAQFTCLGMAQDDGQRVERVRVTPRNGIDAVLSLDPVSGLLASVAERLPTTTDIVRYGDYRQTGSIVLPYRIAEETLDDAADGSAVQIQHYALHSSATVEDFAAPRVANPGTIGGGAYSTTVPVALEARQLIVWASLNGHAPMPFILDTGGHAILTTGAARELGLHPQGSGASGGSGAGTVALQYAPVRDVRIGTAGLRHQTFLVIDYPYSFYERGPREPLAGILGLEVFERFASRIDYGRLRLTLTSLAKYTPPTHAHTASIVFQSDMPLSQAAVDGHAGLFGIDTGNSGTVVLFGDYLQRSGLEKVYAGGVKGVGSGTGGGDAGRVNVVKSLAFADRTLTRVPAFFTDMQSGSFSSWTEAGNFGYEVLSHFVPTFDYARGKLFLESSPLATGPPPNRFGFVAIKVAPATFQVVRVGPQTPAARVGVAPGDQIAAIDRKPATQFSFADLYALLTATHPTPLRLTVVRRGVQRDVVVTPKT